MGVKNFLRRLGSAVVKNAGNLLEPLAFLDPTGVSAAGKAVVDVASDMLDSYRQDRQLGQMRLEMEELLVASQEQLRQEIQVVVAELGESLAEQMREQLAGYLAQAQASARQAARYLGDPSATTVPPTIDVNQPGELAAFLPQRPPRFRPGDAVPERRSWQLVELLGVGGFGEVWKAENRHVGTAAFKFFLDAQARQRFATREAEVLRQVRGQGRREGVVALLDAEPGGDPPWLQFEYVDGGDLSALLTAWQGLSGAERVARVQQTMQALAGPVGHFHRLDPPVVHRDLKPSNILLRRRANAEHELLIADFGIGQVLPAQVNPLAGSAQPAAVMSTIRAYTSLYASPQQKKFHKADRRDDVYALGVIWYQLLRGDLTLERPGGTGWKQALGRMEMSGEALELLESCWDDEPEVRPEDALDLTQKLAGLTGRVVVPVQPREETQPRLDQQLDAAFQEAEAKNRAAQQQFDRHDYAGAVATLEQIPLARLRDEDLYQKAVRSRDRVAALRQEIAPRVVAGPHEGLLALVEEFLQLLSGDAEMTGVRDRLRKLEAVKQPAAGAVWDDKTLKMKLVRVPRGTFWMGGGGGKKGDRQVEIKEDFYIGMYPVTQKQFAEVMGYNPSYFSADGKGKQGLEYESWSQPGEGKDRVQDLDTSDFPVENVSWKEAVEFCRKLSERKGESGRKYRLTTEAGWEYVCRGGHSSNPDVDYSYHFYLDQPSNNLSSHQANFNGNYPDGGAAKGPFLQRTTKVGSYRANRLGLHDMHGNVWEWTGDSEGSYRVIRGGSWRAHGSRGQAALRGWLAPAYRTYYLGFRLALVPSGG